MLRLARKLKIMVTDKMVVFAVRHRQKTLKNILRYSVSRFLSSCLPTDVRTGWKRRFDEEGISDAAESVKWIADHLLKSNVSVDLVKQFDWLCEKRLKR